MLRLLVILLSQTITSATGSYYFVTHKNYAASTLNITSFSSTKLSGDLATVMQQCRRNCANVPRCQAFHITLIQNASNLGNFNCNFFEQNTCNWTRTALIMNISSAIDKLWEKLVVPAFRPKPCIEYCSVAFRGNCTACRGYPALQGFDCEIAPRVCSEYPAHLAPPENVRKRLPMWPWGIYGPKYSVACVGSMTELLFSLLASGTREMAFLGWSSSKKTTDWGNFSTFFKLIDWELVSRIQRLSEQKILQIHFTPIKHIFGGFDLSPRGELSLNSSLNISASPGIPLPLVKAPFVEGFNSSCGHFWQFKENISVCSQLTNLFNFGLLKWNGTTSVGTSVTILFV